MPGNEDLEAPLRVFPGRLSVSRTFGDIEAKLPKYKGRPGVVVAVPDVKAVNITESTDFILLGCDGIFDKLTSNEAVEIVWNKARALTHRGKSMHEICGECVVAVLQQAMEHRSLDNVTVVMIAFKNFKRALEEDRALRESRVREAIQRQMTYSPAGKKMGLRLGKLAALSHTESAAAVFKGNTASFAARRESSIERTTSPVAMIQRSLSPVLVGSLKKCPTTEGQYATEKGRPAALNFAGIKGLMELSKKVKPTI